jgi:hypothetical protein
MRGQNDLPSYQLPALGRRHVHSAMRTEPANVPTAQQSLAPTNSRAMMVINRFVQAVRTEMPVMARRESDTPEPVLDWSNTPNARAEKAKTMNRGGCGVRRECL